MTSSGDDFPSGSSSSRGASTSPWPRATPATAFASRMCTICLGRVRNAAYMAYCRHRFCFGCICQWSARRAECPLCRRPFTSILYTMRADDDYEQYRVMSAESRSSNGQGGGSVRSPAHQQNSSSSNSDYTESSDSERSRLPRCYCDDHRRRQHGGGSSGAVRGSKHTVTSIMHMVQADNDFQEDHIGSSNSISSNGH